MENDLKKLTETANFFRAARDKKAELKKELSAIQETLDVLEASLYDQLEYAGLQSIKTEKGTFFRKNRLTCSCPPENKEIFYAFLRETGEGDIIYETINHNNLARWAEVQIKGGEEVPEYLHINTKHQIGVRK